MKKMSKNILNINEKLHIKIKFKFININIHIPL